MIQYTLLLTFISSSASLTSCSWPMDDAYRNSDGELVKVSKDPPYLLFNMHHVSISVLLSPNVSQQEWHNDTQDTYLPVYKVSTMSDWIVIYVS